MSYNSNQIADEALDFTILDMNFDRFVTMYHGTDQKDLRVIEPRSLNMGNRLNRKIRNSSFWCRDFQYALVWSLDWLAIDLKLPYIHDIEERKFIIPDWVAENKKTGKEDEAKTIMLNMLGKYPVYVYEADIPNKAIGRGQLAIDEYTVDIPVKPKKMITVTPAMVQDLIVTLPDNTFDDLERYYVSRHQKMRLGLREMLVFRDGKRTMQRRMQLINQRKEAWERDKELAVSESFISFCDNLLR